MGVAILYIGLYGVGGASGCGHTVLLLYRPQKPGDKGWVGRARVPMPSTKGYVVRPKWNAEFDFKKSVGKKTLNRYEKHVRKKKQEKMQSKTTHAVPLSVEGRKMPL